jgi:hypothetical protein
MEKYSKEIVKAYNKWSNLSLEEPQSETSKEHQSWKRRDRLAANKFEKLCKESGLNYLEVYKELLGKINLTITA